MTFPTIPQTGETRWKVFREIVYSSAMTEQIRGETEKDGTQ